MSLIHDALRRSGRPATGGRRESDRADGVIAALGYSPTKRRSRRAWLPVAAALVIVVALGAWLWWPRVRGPRSEVRGPTTDVRLPAGASAEAGGPIGVPAATVPLSQAAPATPPPASPVVVHNEPAPAVVRTVPRPPSQPRAASAESPHQPQNGPRTSDLGPRTASAPDDFQLGLYYQRSGDFEQALLHYKSALQRDEMNVEAHNNLGHLYLGKGLADEAAREFQRVIAIAPSYATARINLSAALYSLGRFDAAAAQAREALQIDPKSDAAYVNLALAQKASGQPGDSQLSLRRALELDPRNAAAHYNLARQYEETGEASPALDHYRQFLQYAGADQAAYAQDARARIAALQARMK